MYMSFTLKKRELFPSLPSYCLLSLIVYYYKNLQGIESPRLNRRISKKILNGHCIDLVNLRVSIDRFGMVLDEKFLSKTESK